MKETDDDSLETLDCELLESSSGSQVAIWRPIVEDWRALEARHEGRFRRIMQMWCQGHRLTKEMFNGNEGRSPGNVRVEAFKAFKIRFYGFVRSVGGERTFLVVDHDPAKKQDKADPGILKRSYARVDELAKTQRKER